MLRACIKGERPLVIAGLSDGNLMRLRDGQPIKVALESFGVDLAGDLCIFWGKSEAAIEEQVRKAGLIGPGTQASTDPRIDREAAADADFAHVLIGTVGLPRSGKTTWARGQSWPVVNPDAIRLAIHGNRFIASAEPFVWATAKAMVRALFLAGHKRVILDATNTTRKRRDEWISKEWGTFWKVIDAGRDVCRERSSLDVEILPVIDRMAAQWEPLGQDEQPW